MLYDLKFLNKYALDNISKYNLPIDYISNEQDILTNMTVEDIQQLASTYLNGQNMI